MLLFGLKVSLIGMGIVFAALVFLIFVIKAISTLAKSLAGKATVTAEKKPEAAATNNLTSVAAAVQDETELIAVITAAVSAYSQKAAVIKTITRIVGSPVPVWSTAGRVETMQLRQI